MSVNEIQRLNISGEREDYAYKARGENWQSQNVRPWDTPLTPGGKLQALACGRSIARHCERLGLAPVGQVRNYVTQVLNVAAKFVSSL